MGGASIRLNIWLLEVDFFLPHWDSIFRNPIQPFSFLDAEMDTVVFPQDLVSRDLDWLIVFIPADRQHGHNLNLHVILLCRVVVTNDTYKELKICPMTF